jgi:serine/threonine protein kinase/Tfp pilus assembly protein PilF
MRGRRLSHFRILDTLGEGGMGLVFKAEDESLRRIVALKVLRPGFIADAERRRRFVQEAQAAAAITHPAVAAIYEVGEAEGEVFIAMEYVEGPTLRAVFDKGRPPLAEALRIAAEIARGLDKAHGAGVVHRDLKPENVILGGDGRVKILDFGLAKIRDESSGGAQAEISQAQTRGRQERTREGTILGTVAYMSPEQARGLPVDRRSDLFSFGVLIHEMVGGRNPFRGPTAMDSLSAVLKDTPPAASASNPEVPVGLDRLLERLLAKDPEDRPGSAALVAEELEGLGRMRAGPADGRAARSIAVLPFADMSPQKDQDYLCEGLAEELINSLTQVEGLRVAARSSAFQFKGRADDVRRIGRELGVDCVLEGSVRKSGSRLRVTAQLVGATDGYHLWSQRYDRELEDVFALQDEIAATIVETLRLTLVGEPQHRARRSTENVEAYQLYLQGRYWWAKRHEGGLRKAVDFFEQAIAKDPAYALAHAGVADAYSVIGFYAFAPPKEAFARAKRAAESALALDESLAEAHFSMALIHFWFDWDFERAERAFRRSLAINPSHVRARIFFGQLLAVVGRTGEARIEWQAALDLDPDSPLTHGIVGSGLYFARRYEESLARCRRALEIDPNHIQSLFAFSVSAAELGRYGEAVEAAERAATLSGRSAFFLGVLGFVYATAGRSEEARASLAELEERSAYEYVAPILQARILSRLGQSAAALGRLEQAFSERNSMLFTLATAQEFDALRTEPRYQALLRRLGLEGS